MKSLTEMKPLSLGGSPSDEVAKEPMAAVLNDMLSPALLSRETLADLRNEFRDAFRLYLDAGEEMAKLLRENASSADRAPALRAQQGRLNAALRRYEDARRSYVEAVMGQLAGLSAMGLKVN